MTQAVAAGETPEHAARAFGGSDADLLLTSYDDLAAELAGLDGAAATVAVAAGPGMAAAVRVAARHLVAGSAAGDTAAGSTAARPAAEVLVELPATPALDPDLADALRADGLAVREVRRGGSRPLLVLGGPGGAAEQADPVAAVLAAAVPPPAGVVTADADAAAELAAARAEVTELRARLRQGRRARGGPGGPGGPAKRAAKAPGRPQPAAPAQGPPAPPAPRGLPRRVAAALGLRGRAARLALVAGAALAVIGLVLAVVAVVTDGLLGLLVVLVLGAAVGSAAVSVRVLQVVSRPGAPDPVPAVRRTERQLGRRLDETERLLRAVRKAQRNQGRAQRLGRAAALGPKDLDVRAQRVIEQVQASQLLMAKVDLPVSLPPLGRFTASADLLAVIVDLLVRERPATVVESGSGVSTLVLALTAAQHDLPCRIVALEHDRHYAAQTRALLARHGMADRAEVRYAPLEQTSLPGHPTPWYAAEALADLADVGLVLVDGPPEATGPDARYPMLPLLEHALAPDVSVVADDTRRPTDRAIVERWHADLPGFELVDLGLEKGALLLRRRAGA